MPCVISYAASLLACNGCSCQCVCQRCCDVGQPVNALEAFDTIMGMARLGCREPAQHGHLRSSRDASSQRSTRDHPAGGYDGPRVMQDPLAHLDGHSQRASNAGDSLADAHFRIFPEAFGTERGRVRVKVVSR